MRIAVFDTHAYDRCALVAANAHFGHELAFFEGRLSAQTAPLATGYGAVSVFVNDRVDRQVLTTLHAGGTRVVALRCAGFDNVDLAAAAELGVAVVRVPEYSPHAVAEHAVALLMGLNRKLHRAFARVREGNFNLDGLVGFDLCGKTVGVAGTGKIGRVMATILRGFGCRVLACDLQPDAAWAEGAGVTYVDWETLIAQADVLSLHLPLSAGTRHLIDAATIARMKPGVMLINTSRGGLVDTAALIDGLKRGQVGAAGLDVYEHEAGVFFEDHSNAPLLDDTLARLLTFPNVIVTGHQAFLTDTALRNIAETTLANVAAAEAGGVTPNAVSLALPGPARV